MTAAIEYLKSELGEQTEKLAAITEVWSVGFGHHALYRRTRERATVVAL